MPQHPTYDVIVVGGGAAGLFAAGKAASTGARTLLLEKMNRSGRKLLITGKGRCNVTNSAPMPEFLQQFGPGGRFLRHAFHTFFADDLVTFLETHGVPTVTERGGRIFPQSGAAQDVLDCLFAWTRECGVRQEHHAPVERLLVEDGRIIGVEVAPVSVARTKAGEARELPRRTFLAPKVIVTTGGASYPGTGSTGDGYQLAMAVGHTIVPVRPALVPLETAGNTAARLQGLSLRNVTASLYVDGKKHTEQFGEMLFTHFGVSGPIILTMSREAVDALDAQHKVVLSIDLKPALDDAKLDARLLRDLDSHGKQQFSTLLKDLLPRTLIPVCIDRLGISEDKLANQISSKERRRLKSWLKDFQLQVTGHRSFHEAIVTAGGVNTREVNPQTMESKQVEGLYFAGEVLDIDAETGGYNLQAAFSTGWLAGQAAGG